MRTKNGLLDRRFRCNKPEIIRQKALARRLYIQQLIAVALLGFLAGSILTKTIWDASRPQKLLDPRGTGIIKPVEAKEPLTWNDAIRQVFPKDEAGRMIRICLKENDKAYKWNRVYNKNGSYDFGPCQINSIHKPKNMTYDNWDIYLKDTTNYANQLRHIYLTEGWRAWVVVKKGLVK